MVKIFYTTFFNQLESAVFSHYLKLLPSGLADKVKRFFRWQDAHASLFGKLLLQKGLNEFGTQATLNHIQYNAYNKPFIEGCIDFNISHSGNVVVCAFCDEGLVGIDVEEIKPIDIADFKEQWTLNEWEAINRIKNDYNEFYKYWTIKEAVIKCLGKGLSIPLKSILIPEDRAEAENKELFLQKINIVENYFCYIANSISQTKVIVEEVIF